MSNKSWKRTRRRLRRVREDMDRRGRRAMRIPWYVHAIAWMMSRDYRQDWRRRWEAEHKEKLRRAMKASAHFMRRVEG